MVKIFSGHPICHWVYKQEATCSEVPNRSCLACDSGLEAKPAIYLVSGTFVTELVTGNVAMDISSSLRDSAIETSGPIGSICTTSDSGCRLQEGANCTIESCTSQYTVLIFPFLALILGAVTQPFARALKIPYTLAILFVGVALGLLGCGVDMALLSTSLRQWVHPDPPQIFFYVFLAPLIFEAAYKTRLHVFRRVLLPVLLLAFVLVSLQTGLIAVFQKYAVRTADWSWWAALMFGAMLSATDPISVTATLTSMGASEVLNTLIEGESLVNDGSAFVFWEAFYENTKEPDALTIGEIVKDIFRLSLGGAAMGIAFGVVAVVMLSFLYDEFEVETSITVVVAFLGFWTAQAPSRLSGVICNVASGLFISAFGRPLISSAVRGPLDEFWELLSWIANTIVFVLAGVLVSSFVWSCSGDPHGLHDYLYIPAYFLYLQVIRVGLVFLFLPLISLGNKWLTWKEALVVGLSGLRGTVSLVLALEVGANHEVELNVRSRVVLWTTGIVFLSLLINGMIMKPLVHLLKLDKADKVREDFLHRARSLVLQRTFMVLDSLAVDGGMKHAEWSYITHHVLPKQWVAEEREFAGFEDALEQFGATTSNRASIDIVVSDGRKYARQAELQRLSLDIDTRNRLRAASRSSPGTPVIVPGDRQSRGSLSDFRLDRNSPVPDQASPGASGDFRALNRLSVGSQPERFYPQRASRVSEAGPRRASAEADRERYRPIDPAGDTTRSSEFDIHREIAVLHSASMVAQSIPPDSERDREIRRRLLTSILARVRAFVHSTLTEYAVLVNLDEQIQAALDANESGKQYDMFRFLRCADPDKTRWCRRLVRYLTEMRKYKGETSITTSIILMSALTHVLKEDFVSESPVVLYEAESLFEGAALLLNRLEVLNLRTISWIQSQFAVHYAFQKQDDILEDMVAHGQVDDHEYSVLHGELLQIRRRYFLKARRGWNSAKGQTPRQILNNHALFQDMNVAIKARLITQGNIHHLRPGQVLDATKDCLIVVLNGSIRPAPPSLREEKGSSDPSPETVSSKSSRADNSAAPAGTAALPNCASVMHWCFQKHTSYCAPQIALEVVKNLQGDECPINPGNLSFLDVHYLQSCEEVGSATVWTLFPEDVVSVAGKSTAFRTEIARGLAHRMVLESISTVPAYALLHINEVVVGGMEEKTVIGRAAKLLSRLPYMTVQTLQYEPGYETVPIPIQGPGVLLSGTVRVSIVDNADPEDAVSLLHETITGPALLPVGSLLLENASMNRQSSLHDIETPPARNLHGGSTQISENGLSSLRRLDGVGVEDTGPAEAFDSTGHSRRSVFGNILAEEMCSVGQLAMTRLNRWTNEEDVIDQYGRFAVIRHGTTEGERNCQNS